MTTSADYDKDQAGVLAWLANAASAQKDDERIWPYLEAAAVLSTFRVDTLKPAVPVEGIDRKDITFQLIDRSRIADLGSDLWQLDEDVRRAALRRLRNRTAMRNARQANPEKQDNPVQFGLDRLIFSDRVPSLDGLTLEELLGLERASIWLAETLDQLPTRQDLAARIERERNLAPMRKIAGRGFVDREDERARLADYVGVLPPKSLLHRIRRGVKYFSYLLDERPPLHLYGPGGIGKSAVLARFILDHADPESPQPLPFVYLDFDRAALDPRQPETLVADAIRQLLIEFPWVDPELRELGSQAREQANTLESVDVTRSAQFDTRESLVRRFCRLLSEIAEKNDQPVLMVLDTLEVAERQGESAMRATWGLLSDLLRRVERLRIVSAGRSELKGLPREPVELKGLPDEAAVKLIKEMTADTSGKSISDEDSRRVVSLVGKVPLSLRLASRVIQEEGLNALRDTFQRPLLFLSIKAEQMQGMLYRRILSHLGKRRSPENSEIYAELKKLANPGLILRRITVDIIRSVLAEPCGLSFGPKTQPEHLYAALRDEVGLVDQFLENDALWHLQPVRALMLPDLRAELGGGKTRQIHEAAAHYYRERPSPTPIEKAEEIYHLLWSGRPAADLDALWRPDFGNQLGKAFDEFEPEAKIWLAPKLGIELDKDLLIHADFATWESQTEQRARTLIANGLLEDALKVLRERKNPGRPSPLHALEADALKLMGRLEDAKRVLAEGLKIAADAGDLGATLPLVSRESFLLEASNDLVPALQRAREAIRLSEILKQPLEALSGKVAAIRIARKIKAKESTAKAVKEAEPASVSQYLDAFVRQTRFTALKALANPGMLRELSARPALLRETAAELGAENLEILQLAISQFGISPEDQIALLEYAEESERALENEQFNILDQLRKGTTAHGQGNYISQLVPVFAEFFASRLKLTVEDSLHQVIQPSGQSKSREPDVKVSDSLVASTVDIFSPSEIRLLLQDNFDIDFEKISPAGSSYPEQVAHLFKWAEQTGVLEKLLPLLRRSRSEASTLAAFGGQANAALEAAPPGPPTRKTKGRWQNTKGYNPDFLKGHSIPLPRSAEIQQSWEVLHYEHFSIVMHPERRLACLAAANVNIDRVNLPRPKKEEWLFDDRLPSERQVGDDIYRRSQFDRSRLVKRLQPAWGDRRTAARASTHTNYFTNTIPLHGQLNRNLLWVSLPDFILEKYAQDGKMVMFAGPVFHEQDPLFRGVKIPRATWRIAVFMIGGTLRALGFLATQDLPDNPEEWRHGNFLVCQVPISAIESITRLDFGALLSFDALDSKLVNWVKAASALGRPLSRPSDVVPPPPSSLEASKAPSQK